MYFLAQKWHTTFQFQKNQISNSYLSKFETSKIHSKSTFTTKFLNCGKKAHQHSTMISGMKSDENNNTHLLCLFRVPISAKQYFCLF